MTRRVLVTGGAGFVGANLCVALAERHADTEFIAFDNLYRQGSSLNLPRLAAAGVTFTEGDVRDRSALAAVGEVDALVECSAEPSVLAGVGEDPSYAVETNLIGAWNCLELARTHGAQFIFLSTSRVYPVEALRSIKITETATRFQLEEAQALPGVSAAGISEDFPTTGPRTLYGTTKLAAELLTEEYAGSYGLETVINRCGVIAGPWQMGKVDQGVFTWWLLAHHFGLPLEYIGFGGSGHQVRDLLHVDDLVDLIDAQLAEPVDWAGRRLNVGGGLGVSLSLAEATDLCRELTGREVPIGVAPEDRPGDIPVYLTDTSRLRSIAGWRPRRSARETLSDTLDWILSDEDTVRSVLIDR